MAFFFFINIIPTGTSLLLCICDSDRAATIIYVLRSLNKCDLLLCFTFFTVLGMQKRSEEYVYISITCFLLKCEFFVSVSLNSDVLSAYLRVGAQCLIIF